MRLTREARSRTPDDDSDSVGDGDLTVTYGFDSVGNRTAMTKIAHDPAAVTKVMKCGCKAGGTKSAPLELARSRL